MKRYTSPERAERLRMVERYRATVREGAPCRECGARRNERCTGKQGQPIKRNHEAREKLFQRWCREQAEAERLDRMMGRSRRG